MNKLKHIGRQIKCAKNQTTYIINHLKISL